MPNQLNKKKKHERKTNASNQFTIEMRNDLKRLCVCVFVCFCSVFHLDFAIVNWNEIGRYGIANSEGTYWDSER